MSDENDVTAVQKQMIQAMEKLAEEAPDANRDEVVRQIIAMFGETIRDDEGLSDMGRMCLLIGASVLLAIVEKPELKTAREIISEAQVLITRDPSMSKLVH